MTSFEWWFRSRDNGRITIAQAPNPSLAIWLSAGLIRWIVHPEGWPATGLTVVATVAIGWWSVDEIWRGVNPFRRVLGAVVLVATVAGAVSRG